MSFWMFILILVIIVMAYKILELLSYTLCWIFSDNEAKEKLLNSSSKVRVTVKEITEDDIYNKEKKGE